MTDNDIKKSLSLKSHKNTSVKQSKSTSAKKNVTIQVRRKKIFNAQSLQNQNNNKTDEPVKTTAKVDVNHKTTTLSTNKSKSKPIETITTKKKTKIDKDAKVESFENKELHLKEPKHKKINKKESNTESDLIAQHQFEKPTEPIKKIIEIPNSITVSDLAQKISIKINIRIIRIQCILIA